jgi:hypothetical protein
MAGDMAKREQKNQEEHGEGLLVGAAKAIGGLAGKVAAAVGVNEHETSPATPTTKSGKLAPKNKSRLPRREKKARKKAANLRAA